MNFRSVPSIPAPPVIIAPGSTGDLARGNDVVSYNGRFFFVMGDTVKSANNLTPALNGCTFHVTGSTQINLISNQLGTSGKIAVQLTLLFDSTPTIKHNNALATDKQFRPILLNGSADFVATANSTLTVIYDATNDRWVEVARMKQ